jgi:drug/metabolite transporter (DMT)-like permease
MGATFYALSSRTLPLADTVTLLNLTPLFLAALAPFVLGERTTLAVALALLLSLAGVVLVLHPSFSWRASELPGPSAGATALVAVLAAFISSLAMMLLRRVGRTESPEAIALHFSLFAAAVLSALSLLDLRMPTARDAAFTGVAGVCAGFGQLAITRAYALERAARVSGMGYLAVVASGLLGAAVLGERPAGGAVLGMLLVVAGGLIVTFVGQPKEPSPSAKR